MSSMAADPSAHDDATLVAAALAGDGACAELLVRRHLEAVRGVCRRRLPQAADVEDAVQDVFLRAITRLDDLEDPACFGAWVRSIAARRCVDHHRAAARTQPVAAVDRIDPWTPAEVAVEADEARRLHQHLGTLAERDRRALWLRDAEGVGISALASDLGLTEASTRVMLTRARHRLRRAYRGIAIPVLALVTRLRTRVHQMPDGAVAAMTVSIPMLVMLAVVAPDAQGSAEPDPPAALADAQVAAAPVASHMQARDERAGADLRLARLALAAGPTQAGSDSDDGGERGLVAPPTADLGLVRTQGQAPDQRPAADLSARAGDEDEELLGIGIYDDDLLAPLLEPEEVGAAVSLDLP